MEGENKIEFSQNSEHALFSMIYHHISHFLIESRLDEKYEEDSLIRSIELTENLKVKISDKELIKQIEILLEKLKSVKIGSFKDDKLLDEISKTLDDVMKFKN